MGIENLADLLVDITRILQLLIWALALRKHPRVRHIFFTAVVWRCPKCGCSSQVFHIGKPKRIR